MTGYKRSGENKEGIINSFSKYLLRAFYVPDIVLDTLGVSVKNTKILVLTEPISEQGKTG